MLLPRILFRTDFYSMDDFGNGWIGNGFYIRDATTNPLGEQISKHKKGDPTKVKSPFHKISI